MNIKIILKLLSLLLLAISFFMGTSVVVALIYHEPILNLLSFLIPIGVNIIFFGIMFLLFRDRDTVGAYAEKWFSFCDPVLGHSLRFWSSSVHDFRGDSEFYQRLLRNQCRALRRREHRF